PQPHHTIAPVPWPDGMDIRHAATRPHGEWPDREALVSAQFPGHLRAGHKTPSPSGNCHRGPVCLDVRKPARGRPTLELAGKGRLNPASSLLPEVRLRGPKSWP